MKSSDREREPSPRHPDVGGPSENLWLMHGDCIERMKAIPSRSVDAVIVDLPYETTQCTWDSMIPLPQLWEAYKRVVKKDALMIFTSNQPFTTKLIASNYEWYRWEDVWDKESVTGFLDSNRRPLRQHETVQVFCQTGQWTYNPQMLEGSPYKGNKKESTYLPKKPTTPVYGQHSNMRNDNDGYRYPSSIIKISKHRSTIRQSTHPTEKPVELLEYLILTYTNKGDVVLDNSMGSGSCGEACIRTGRRFIGIELAPIVGSTSGPRFFEETRDRLVEASNSPLPSSPVPLRKVKVAGRSSALFEFPEAQ